MSGFYVVEYEVWPTDEENVHLGRHTNVDVQRADTEIEAINAVVCYIRGEKSRYELARVGKVVGPFDEMQQARELQYNKYKDD